MVSLTHRPAAERLWELNQAYSQRLSRARSQLDLLIRLLEREARPLQTLESLLWARHQLEELYLDHRAWRYRYFYGGQQQNTPRMVREETAVMTALTQLERLGQRSVERLHAIARVFNGLERPTHTRLPQGDLWEILIDSLNDLAAPLDD